MPEPLTPLSKALPSEFEDGLIELVEEMLEDALDNRSQPIDWREKLTAYVRANLPKTVKLPGHKAYLTTEDPDMISETMAFEDGKMIDHKVVYAGLRKPFSGTADPKAPYET